MTTSNNFTHLVFLVIRALILVKSKALILHVNTLLADDSQVMLILIRRCLKRQKAINTLLANHPVCVQISHLSPGGNIIRLCFKMATT